MKRTIALILSLLIVFSVFAVVPVGAADFRDLSDTGYGTSLYSGSTGTGVIWTYYDDNTLVFSGSGPIGTNMDWVRKPDLIGQY